MENYSVRSLQSLSEEQIYKLVDKIIEDAPKYLAMDTTENSANFIKTRLMTSLKESTNSYGRRESALASIAGYLNAFQTIESVRKNKLNEAFNMFDEFSKTDNLMGMHTEYLPVILGQSKYIEVFKDRMLENLKKNGASKEKIEEVKQKLELRIKKLKEKGLLESVTSDKLSNNLGELFNSESELGKDSSKKQMN